MVAAAATHLLTATEGLRGFPRSPLRHRNELHALKLYLLFLAFCNVRANFAAIGYEKIIEASGVSRGDISGAGSLLIHQDLIRVSQSQSNGAAGHPHNRYMILRLAPSSLGAIRRPRPNHLFSLQNFRTLDRAAQFH